MGQNAFFYDASEGLLASLILLIAEFGEKNERHIVSVFKMIQDLLTPIAEEKKAEKKGQAKPKNGFKISSNWAWKIQARTAEITYNENIKQIRRLLSAMELLTSLLAIEKYLFILWYLFGGVNVVLVHQHITKPAYDR